MIVTPRSTVATSVTATRVVALSGSAAASLLAGVVFLHIAAADGIDWIDILRSALVVIATFWLAWGASLALIGVFHRETAPPEVAKIEGRTVILVPIHQEDPVATFARIAAIDVDLRAEGLACHVQIAILSDTPDDSLAAHERHWFTRLVEETGAEGRFFYRRRTVNNGRKAGNIADFIRRSGGAWDYALILDADSLLAASTIGRMIRRMEASPRLGLLQSAPAVIRARSRFGRVTQFAGTFHGAVYTRGLAAMQGVTGPFWGHNALVRIPAFAQSCGLPELSGPPPFGGHVLSHDYVEAALLARAGWDVRLDPDLHHSFEEGPETILSHARRDRRWCQGNLQHARLLTAPGLQPWSRFIFVQGILAYVAPVLWIAFLIASILSPVVAAPLEPILIPFVGANPLEGSMAEWLMANGPLTDWAAPLLQPDMAATALGLALGVVGLLVVPKLVILTQAVLTGRVRHFGGALRAAAGVLAELALSAITAPILLMFQARAVAEVLTGRDGGWPAQARSEAALTFAEAWAASRWIVAIGAAGLGVALILAPSLMIWLLPVGLPLLLAPGIIAFTSHPGGKWLFATPPDLTPPAVMQHQTEILGRWQGDGAERPGLRDLRATVNG